MAKTARNIVSLLLVYSMAFGLFAGSPLTVSAAAVDEVPTGGGGIAADGAPLSIGIANPGGWADNTVKGVITLGSGDILNIDSAAGSPESPTSIEVSSGASAAINSNGGTYGNVNIIVDAGASLTLSNLYLNYSGGYGAISVAPGASVSINDSAASVYTFTMSAPGNQWVVLNGATASGSMTDVTIQVNVAAGVAGTVTLNAPPPPVTDSVCQIGSVQYATLDEALAAVPENAATTTIKLLQDITRSSNSAIDNKNITFDLNGKNLIFTSLDESALTMVGSNFDYINAGTFQVIAENNSGLSIDGGSCRLTYAEASGEYQIAISATDGASVVVNGDVKATGLDSWGISATGGSNVTVNNGAVTSTGAAVCVYSDKTLGDSTVIVNGNISAPDSAFINVDGVDKPSSDMEYMTHVNGTYTIRSAKAADSGTVGPSISGPSGMTLSVGYAAKTSEPFTVTGSPKPTVTVADNPAAITWDSGSNKLNIAAGLAAGTYTVTLTATSNGVSSDPIKFTLTVTKDQVYDLNVSCSTGGTVSVSGSYSAGTDITVMATAGTVINITATPDSKHTFAYWESDSGTIGNKNSASTTFIMPAQDALVITNFSPKSSGTSGGTNTNTTNTTNTTGTANLIDTTVNTDVQNANVYGPCTITFDTQGGDNVPKGYVGWCYKLDRPADPKRDGYTFTGWYTDSSCTAQYDFDAQVKTSFTLYAGWQAVLVPTPTSIPAPEAAAPVEPIRTDYFDDIGGHWAEAYINSLAALGFVHGADGRRFAPNGNLTRAQFAQLIYNAFGNGDVSAPGNPFTDCNPAAWYTPALNWAYANGIITGYSDTAFGPRDSVTREQMAVLFVRAAGKFNVTLPADSAKNPFVDDGDIDGYAYDAVYAMQQAGIISGESNNMFKPLGTATRADAAKMMYGVLSLAGKIGDDYKIN